MRNVCRGNDAVDLLLETAWTHFSRREFAQAESCFLQAQETSPALHVSMAFASYLGRLGRNEEAIRVLEEIESAVAWNEDFSANVSFCNQLAEQYRQTRQWTLAHRAQQRAVSLELKDAFQGVDGSLSVQTQLGCAGDFIASGEYGAARSLLFGIINHSDAMNAEAYYELGRVALLEESPATASSNLRKAYDRFQRRFEFDQSLEAVLLEARSLVELGQHFDAIDRLESAVTKCDGKTIRLSIDELRKPLQTLRRRIGVLMANPEWN